MTDTAIAGQPPRFTAGSLERQLLGAAAVTAIADWLFFDHAIGISAAIFALTVCVTAAATNPIAKRRDVALACAALAIGLMPLVESVNVVSVLFGAAGTAIFALVSTGQHGPGLGATMKRLATLVFIGPFRLLPDILLLRKIMQRSGRAAKRVGLVATWLLPLGFGAAFVLLFVSANPLIEQIVTSLDIDPLFDRISFYRIAFWLVAVSATWPFIRVKLHRARKAKTVYFKPPVQSPEPAASTPIIPAKEMSPADGLAYLFNPAAVVRSLALFNALFAVQTIMDAAYLWGGLALPEGMSYAAYAHRGAYPLIVTALLAALFVLIAMRPGAETAGAPLVRNLVYLWIGQNVLLVVSSVLRLDLYVAYYALTYLRIAAFIWMLVVVVGLVLIVARIALDKSNAWLVAANLINLALVLYVCSFVNFAHIIASYNVTHSLELSNEGISLDERYLVSLGPQAIPAIDTFLTRMAAGGHAYPTLVDCRHRLASEHKAKMAADWRAWSYRGARLVAYLDDRGIVRTANNDHATTSTGCRRAGHATSNSGRR